MNDARHTVFEASLNYPDPDAQRRFAALVGIDDLKQRLEKSLRLILDPHAIERWSEQHHRRQLPIIGYFKKRPPLFILAGDVGTGKTALAESVGDAVARAEKLDVTLYRLSLASRGSGLVGEMTKLLADAFASFGEAAGKAKGRDGKARAGSILLIDEADALAQSRETSQMHHEDRAGVNVLIRGIDDIGARALPAAIILCTNRISAIDPAVRRRAADVLVFARPTAEQRAQVLANGLHDLGFTAEQIAKLATATGDGEGTTPFTYSDLTQRFLPNLVLESYPDKPINFARALALAERLKATPSFGEDSSA
jgi:SpoVK/Ycf46/Vps4 family AAA+-type ATPase